MDKPKIYLTALYDSPGNYLAYALAEDGAGLGSHLSSSIEWAKHDIGLTADWHHGDYREHYPEGYELIWIDNPEVDERWQTALALNHAQALVKV